MPIVPVELVELLRRSDRVLVASHAQPDGDAAGASVALAWALRTMDINVIVYNETGFPTWLDWLRLPSPVITRVEDLPCKPDLIVALDCGDAARLGADIQPLLETVPVVNIDHHLGNPGFGTAFNWVDPGMAATGQMVGLLAEALNVPLHGALGEAVYVALVTDTGSFAYGNTTAQCLHLTARLLESGLNVVGVRAKLDNSWSETRLRLWGRLMSEARLLEGGKLATVTVHKAMLDELGADKEDLEGFVEQLRRVRGVRVAFVLRDMEKDGRIISRVSLRSSGDDDVRAVAVQFGGGGHKNAAGATLDLEADKAFAVMLPYIRHVWNKVRL